MKKLILFLLISFNCLAQISPEMRKLTEEANALELKGDYEGAISKHKKVLELDPKSFHSANTIAGLYGILGRYNEEIQWAQKAIKLNPKFSKAYLNLGNAYTGKGDFTQGEISYKQAGVLDPKDPFVPYNLGLLSEYRKDIPQALKYYEQSTKTDSTFENGYFSMASIFMNQKKYDKAEKCIRKVLEIHPDAVDAQDMKKEIDRLKKQVK